MLSTKTYLEPYRYCRLKLLTIFAKNSMADIRMGFNYTSEVEQILLE